MLDDPDILSDLDQLSSRYHVLRHMGYDGASAVYAVRGRDSDRHYLVKLMPKPGAGSAQAGTLHLWQAHAIERLEHPKLIALRAVHHLQGGTLGIAMERRRGRTPAERIAEEGALPPAEVESMLRDVAEALAYLHARGVVHRGVNSDSILFDRDSGCARLAHFGIPSSVTGGEGARGDGASLRRALAYEAPEQVGGVESSRGSETGPWSDLYSLALVGYAMLTGREVCVGEEPLPPLEAVRADVPPHLCRAIEACLVRAPRRRLRSVEELLARLDPQAEVPPTEPRADLAGLEARVGRAVAAIRAAVAERSNLRRPPVLALALPAVLVTLVGWAVLRPDYVAPPTATDAQPLPSATTGSSETAGSEVSWERVTVQALAVDTAPRRPPSEGGGTVRRRAVRERRALPRSPASRPAVLGDPVDPPAAPRLLGEELASAGRRR